jgi:Bacterial PH domain
MGFAFPLIVVAVTGLLALMAWAAQRGRPTADPASGRLVFRHSGVFRGFALFAAFGIPLGITVLVLFHPPKNDGDLIAIGFIYGLFAVLSFPLLWETMLYSVAVSDAGIDARSPWRGRRAFAWDEIEQVTWSNFSGSFVFRSTDGRTISVRGLTAGVSEFLGACERHLPLEVLEGAQPGYGRIGRVFPRAHYRPPRPGQQIGRDF